MLKINLRTWTDAIFSLKEIADVYEKTSSIFGLFLDRKIRILGMNILLKESKRSWSIIDIGAGPGTLETILLNNFRYVIHFDLLLKMTRIAKKRINNPNNLDYVIGVSEALPFRKNSFDVVISSFSFRDSPNKLLELKEVSMIVRNYYIVIDIGRPDNRFVERVEFLYLKYFVPLIAGIYSRKGYKNPWRILYKTFLSMPTNNLLLLTFSKFFKKVKIWKYLFGGAILLIAQTPIKS